MEQQMIMNKRNSYVEILEILKYMDKIYVNKIPKKIIRFFEDNKASDYEFKFDVNIELEKQVLNENTLALLAILNLNYWCENEEHKKELISQYNKNEQKYQEELREKYNPDNLFKNMKIKVELSKNSVVMVEYKESFFTKIKNRIKRIF